MNSDKSRTKGLKAGLWLCAAALLCGTPACDDRIETGEGGKQQEGETVEVTVRLGFAPEENAAEKESEPRAAAGTDRRQAFRAELQTQAATRAADVTPDGLYELYILQFDANGNQLSAGGSSGKNTYYKAGKTDTGTALPLNLTTSDDCQLVIITRGEGITTTPTITDGNLASIQAFSFDRDVIDAIPTSGATQEQMNKMPYVLHLKHVKVGGGKLQSPDVETVGAHDVRLMLKRLAARVTVKWNYSVKVDGADYELKQLLLQNVPFKFNYIPNPDENGVYPDIMKQYTTLNAKDYHVEINQATGTHSFWMPANVREDNPAVSSPLLRIKDNASPGSSYLTFEAVNKEDANKKFRYRFYIGDEKPENFSVKSNTDYIYDITFRHQAIPASDRRVTYVDPVPASKDNDNFVPTANCFMVPPGGSFCFDPFMFRSGGTDSPNSVLAGWIASGKTTSDNSIIYGMKYVKLFWQTKEEGDIGEPVMGIVNSESDHTNIVDLKGINGENFSDPSTTAATTSGQCRIYCRVAPGTTGGSGLIAAYDTNDKVLWSWHVWVTDYSPSSTGTESVLDDENKRKLKFDYNNAAANQLPMMDRNLGALAGYVAVPEKTIDKAKSNGFHYQWGRKDPFPSTYTNDPKTTTIPLPEKGTKPIEGMLNLYKADGVTYLPFSMKVGNPVGSYQEAYQNPHTVYKTECPPTPPKWINWFDGFNKAWDVTKTVHDPCPAGWRVAQRGEYLSFWKDKNATITNNNNLKGDILLRNPTTVEQDAGVLVGYDNNEKNGTYFHFMGYLVALSFGRIGSSCLIWSGTHSGNTDGKAAYFIDFELSTFSTGSFSYFGHEYEAIPLRCIQEKAD